MPVLWLMCTSLDKHRHYEDCSPMSFSFLLRTCWVTNASGWCQKLSVCFCRERARWLSLCLCRFIFIFISVKRLFFFWNVIIDERNCHRRIFRQYFSWNVPNPELYRYIQSIFAGITCNLHFSTWTVHPNNESFDYETMTWPNQTLTIFCYQMLLF